MRGRDIACALAVIVIWGLNFPISKVGVVELPPILLIAIRFAVVALLLCPFRPLPRGKGWPIFLMSMSLGSVHFSLMFTGLQLLDTATVALLTQVQVPIATLLAALIFKDRLGLHSLVGMVMSFIGVLLIVGQPRFGDSLIPVALVLLASLVWAIGNLQVKAVGAIDPLALNGWIALFAAPQLALLSLLLESGHERALTGIGWHGVNAIAYNALAVGVVSYALWYPLMRRYTVNQMMPFTLLVPVIGVGGGVLFLGDRLGWQEIAGGLLTIAGVAILVLRRSPGNGRAGSGRAGSGRAGSGRAKG